MAPTQRKIQAIKSDQTIIFGFFAGVNPIFIHVTNNKQKDCRLHSPDQGQKHRFLSPTPSPLYTPPGRPPYVFQRNKVISLQPFQGTVS